MAEISDLFDKIDLGNTPIVTFNLDNVSFIKLIKEVREFRRDFTIDNKINSFDINIGIVKFIINNYNA